MTRSPFDPVGWGIDALTAQELDRFAGPALPRVSRGRITDVAPPPAVAARVGCIGRMARMADPGGWYWETRAPHPAFRRVDSPAESRGRVNAWTAQDDATFAENWTSDLSDFVDGIIAVYSSAWPAAISVLHEDSNPVDRFARDLLDAGKIVPARIHDYTREQLVDYKCFNAVAEGPFNVTVERRTWEFPTKRACECCGAEHYSDIARYYLLRHYGPPGLCAPCMSGAMFGLESTGQRRSDVLDALRSFSDDTHTIPTTSFRQQMYTSGAGVDRGVIVAQLLAIPAVDEVRRITGCGSWLEVLQAAGIVAPMGWRPGYGTMCLAKDGHFCRSLAEQAICDWLYAFGVEHTVEPLWPRHPKLNPSGRMRADWAIGDLYVEFAGLMTSKDYREKMGRKKRLAEITGIELLVIEPEHLPRLRETLSPALGIDLTGSP